MTGVQLKEIQAYLEDNKLECLYIENPDGDYLFVDIDAKGDTIRLKCTFPISFPYNFPKIYILKEFYKKYKPLPHITDLGEDNFICTFDSNVVFPNFNKPKEVTLECIRKAEQIIIDGIEGINNDDFKSELLFYWEIDSKIKAEIIFTPENYSVELYYYVLNDKFLFISDNEVKLINYLMYVKDIKLKSYDLSKALYLPLDNNWIPPFPISNEEVFNKLKNETYYNDYIRYLRKYKSQHVIVFSQIIDNTICLGGWVHKKRPTPDGFRLNRAIPEYVYGYLYRNDTIDKFTVKQLNHNRLFERGGDGNIKDKLKVSITGCGSIGSNLAKTLLDLGINNFLFIDNETLSSDNIARHYCGASHIGKNKVLAMKEEILSHFPDTNLEIISKDIFQVLEDDIEKFNQLDFNFLVVGNIPIEHKLVSLFNDGYIEKPLIIIWVEPYLTGGHVVILQEKQTNIINKLFGADFTYSKSVLLDGDIYVKREGGCGSTFLPYSAFEVQQFLNTIMDYINKNVFEKKNKRNYILSWCGRLDVARKNRMKISPQWLGEDNRKLRVEILNNEEL